MTSTMAGATLPAHADQMPPAPAGHGNGTRPRPLAAAVVDELVPRVRGDVFLDGDAGYDESRAGYNLAVERRPVAVVRVSGAADVTATVAFATVNGLPVGVVNSGHGSSASFDGGILVDPRHMRSVRVDPMAGVARVEAGARWDDVVHEAAGFGLAPLSGSSPRIGAVGYTLGGGLGLLGRTFGYAADHVRSIDVVTRHGMLRQVTADQYADLFWALRGGLGNFGVVTSMEIGLFPVARLYGGGLYFRGSAAADVFAAYRRWLHTVPDEVGSSIALTRFPWSADVPEDLRGRFVVHVRIAYHGSAADGEALVRPLRRVALPILDTVTDRPYTTSGEIHDDPPFPFALYETTACLRELDEDAVDALLHAAGPDSSCPLRLVEVRHLGGALGRSPLVPNAVGNRDAAFLLYVAGVSGPDGMGTVRDCGQLVLDRMAPWATGGVNPNFLGAADATSDGIRAAYTPEDYRRLGRVKRAYDPENLFRLTHNIPPAS